MIKRIDGIERIAESIPVFFFGFDYLFDSFGLNDSIDSPARGAIQCI